MVPSAGVSWDYLENQLKLPPNCVQNSVLQMNRYCVLGLGLDFVFVSQDARLFSVPMARRCSWKQGSNDHVYEKEGEIFIQKCKLKIWLLSLNNKISHFLSTGAIQRKDQYHRRKSTWLCFSSVYEFSHCTPTTGPWGKRHRSLSLWISTIQKRDSFAHGEAAIYISQNSLLNFLKYLFYTFVIDRFRFLSYFALKLLDLKI